MTAIVISSIKNLLNTKSSFPDLNPRTKYRDLISKDINYNVTAMIHRDWNKSGVALRKAMHTVREEYEQQEHGQQTKTDKKRD